MMLRPMVRPAHTALALLLLLALGCRPVKKVFQADRELPLRSAERVVEHVFRVLPPQPRYFSAKADVELTMADAARSFRSTVRSVADSAVWVSITPALGIEVARALVTTDSVKLLDRLKDSYFLGDRDSAWARFGIDPDLDLLQQALLGRPIGLDPQARYRVDREDGHYVLTSRERRRFVRAAEDILPDDTLANERPMNERRLERTLRKAGEREAVVLRYWVEPDGFRVVRVLVSDLAHDQQADVRYTDIGTGEAPPFPHRISLSLSDPARHASGTLQLSRIDTLGPLQLPFRVPERFVPME